MKRIWYRTRSVFIGGVTVYSIVSKRNTPILPIRDTKRSTAAPTMRTNAGTMLDADTGSFTRALASCLNARDSSREGRRSRPAVRVSSIHHGGQTQPFRPSLTDAPVALRTGVPDYVTMSAMYEPGEKPKRLLAGAVCGWVSSGRDGSRCRATHVRRATGPPKTEWPAHERRRAASVGVGLVCGAPPYATLCRAGVHPIQARRFGYHPGLLQRQGNTPFPAGAFREPLKGVAVAMRPADEAEQASAPFKNPAADIRDVQGRRAVLDRRQPAHFVHVEVRMGLLAERQTDEGRRRESSDQDIAVRDHLFGASGREHHGSRRMPGDFPGRALYVFVRVKLEDERPAAGDLDGSSDERLAVLAPKYLPQRRRADQHVVAVGKVVGAISPAVIEIGYSRDDDLLGRAPLRMKKSRYPSLATQNFR